MISKPHRLNSDFQIKYFLAGNRKTPDGAYSLLYSLKIDIEHKLAVAESQRLEREAKIEEQEELLKSKKSWQIKLAQAEIIKLKAAIPTWEMNLKAAQDELNTIINLMDQLEPLRKYSHLSLLEANELSQRDEWKLELMERAENQIISNRLGIGWDDLNTMRSHPDFKDEILPAIVNTTRQMDRLSQARNTNSDNLISLLEDAVSKNEKNVLALIEHKKDG